MQQLAQRLFAELAVRKRQGLAGAVGGGAITASAVHMTACTVAEDGIVDLLRVPGLAPAGVAPSPPHLETLSRPATRGRSIAGCRVLVLGPIGSFH